MNIALAASLLCSAIYTATIATGDFTGRWAVKAASVAALAVLVRKYPLLALALFLGSIGDALLDYNPGFFVTGLIAFLLGHLVYTACFGAKLRFSIPAVLLVAYSATFVWWLWPSLGALRIPVMVYIAAITAMAISSLRIGGWVSIGAILFVISDSLLAANRFKTAIPMRDYLVWLTYYGAQAGIALGYLRVKASTKPGMV